MNLQKAKQALIDFQKKHESYLDAVRQYQDYCNLPFWKKWFAEKPQVPNRSYLYETAIVFSSTRCRFLIELRMYYSGTEREITLAVNEGNCGYRLNVETDKKSSYLGRVNPNISEYAENLLKEIRSELAPLIVE